MCIYIYVCVYGLITGRNVSPRGDPCRKATASDIIIIGRNVVADASEGRKKLPKTKNEKRNSQLFPASTTLGCRSWGYRAPRT